MYKFHWLPFLTLVAVSLLHPALIPSAQADNGNSSVSESGDTYVYNIVATINADDISDENAWGLIGGEEVLITFGVGDDVDYLVTCGTSDFLSIWVDGNPIVAPGTTFEVRRNPYGMDFIATTQTEGAAETFVLHFYGDGTFLLNQLDTIPINFVSGTFSGGADPIPLHVTSLNAVALNSTIDAFGDQTAYVEFLSLETIESLESLTSAHAEGLTSQNTAHGQLLSGQTRLLDTMDQSFLTLWDAYGDGVVSQEAGHADLLSGQGRLEDAIHDTLTETKERGNEHADLQSQLMLILDKLAVIEASLEVDCPGGSGHQRSRHSR